jgi:dimethylargininase
VALARDQHAAYEMALEACGCRVVQAAAAPDHADSVFVEDTAVVLPEIAVMTRPGAGSRRGEVPGIEVELRHHREIAHIEAPGTVDGGDVMAIGRTVFVGVGARTNQAGFDQLAGILHRFGYAVSAVSGFECLHLKSAVTALDESSLLISPTLIDKRIFAPYRLIEVAPEEPGAANALSLPGHLIYPDAYPASLERLTQAGFDVSPVPCSEIIKAEGAVTCCSLLIG